MGIENKLDRNNTENFMALTSMQQGMLFHYINDKNSREYHEQLSLTIIGDVRIELLQKAWDFVIESNEMIRTVFRWKGIDKPVQIVLKKHEVIIQYMDFTNEIGKDKAVENIKLKDFSNRIDVTKETLRIYLCKLDDYKYEMVISNHHILYDGWSNGIILKELMETYTCLYKDENLKRINKTKFSEFIKYIKHLNVDEQKNYWTNYLHNLDSTDDCFGSKEKGISKEISYKIYDVKANKVKDFTKENKILLSSVLYGAWGVLIQKLSNSNEALFGTTVSGRPENIKSIDKMVGLFINTIPLRIKSENNTTFINLIHGVDIALNERKGFENTSLVDIKEDCGLKVNEDIFNSIITIENYPLDLSLNKENILSIENFSMKEEINYNMALEILTFDGIEFKFNFNSAAIDENIVKRLGRYLERLIDILLNNPTIEISEVSLLSEGEKNQILHGFNDTKADYPKDKTIQQLFEEQVEKTPNNIAVVFEDKKLTYRELNEKSNQLARVLRSKGVQVDTIVGIMVDRSVEMIIGIMGILKSGGAYLPIDSKNPKHRIEYMIEDAKVDVLVISNEITSYLKFSGSIVNITDEDILKVQNSNIGAVNKCNDLAYVIYTSGSTGNPKGVMVEHKQVTNFIHGIVKETGLEQYESILCITTISFDIFGLETLVPLTQGLKIVVSSEEENVDGEKLGAVIEKNGVEIMQSTPSRFKMLLENSKFKSSMIGLKTVLIGGEELPEDLVRELNKYEKLKVYNVYGPTETTIWSTSKLMQKEDRVTIGKPINNTKIYIVDSNKQIVPIGVAGELCISGDGVARGYLNRKKLTLKKFVRNPFESGQRMYKTGDLARWLADGDIEFLGRIDNQVKIRGFRIELGEIENRLLQHEDIKEAIIIVKESKDNDKYICAYVVCQKEISDLNLKDYLKESLPKYMIPSYFIQLEKMPLTLNGKLDKKALPEPNEDAYINGYEAPRNEAEEKLAKIWSEILGVEKIGINDNFFEQGGHSLKAMALISKIHKELNREISLKELFKSPTIKELSNLVKNIKKNPYSKIEKVEEQEYYKASSAQKRMYMLQQFEKDSVSYNIPVVFELEGEIDKGRIEETFKKLYVRHEALRTYFETVEGEIVQKIDNSYEFRLVDRKDNEKIETIINKFIRLFELEKSPLFRVELVESREKTYLLIDMHHIISDGVSMSILIKEFTTLYNGESLESLKLQYKDFAVWQNNFLKSQEMKKQEEYWINKFNDEIPVLNLPYDYERPVIQSFEGDGINFEVDEKTTVGLRRVAKETGTTMHMILLSAFNIVLSKYSGQEDIVVGTPIAGRPHADLQNIMGMFVNTLALRNKPQGDKKYLEFLKEVKENSLKAYETQSYQLEALVEKVNVRRDTSRNPLFDVMFNMDDTVTGNDIELEGLLLKQYNDEVKISKFDLTLNALEIGKTLEFSIEYCSKLFNKDTIERLSNHYISVLDNIISNTEIKICEIELLTEKEKNQILYEFNDTKADYPKDKIIQEIFEAQVEKTPDNVAVVFEDEKLTYRELNKKANQLAIVLRNKDVKADFIVGIMVERSLEMIIGIMGILKAGGAYLPIDPSYPKERIKYMLKDSGSKILLSTESLIDNIEFNGEVIDLFDEGLFKGDSSNLAKINNSSDLTYVMYTSGTTGNPKGVMIEHKNLTSYVYTFLNEFKLSAKDIVLQQATYCFDGFVDEVYPILSIGGRFIICNKYDALDIRSLENIISKHKISVIDCSPLFLNELNKCENISSIHTFISGGDILKQSYINNLINYARVYNTYGPTETTVNACCYKCEDKSIHNIPIGKPIKNYRTYILDQNRNLVPIGIVGELYISGDGVGRGYLNRKALTNEKFVEDPFELSAKIYKTGDLVRWLPDGNIEFLGRIDNQVKIRGFRIELGEIENRLLQHEEVKEAAVVVNENKEKEKCICAYVISEKEISGLKLKSYLKESLPEYMVPAYFVQLEKMPLTTNGKLDRIAFPEPNLDTISNKYEAPRNKIEEELSKVWSEVLGVEKIGINDNFFELGGHSLKATVLISKIHKELNREIPLKELFKSPTIKELSEFIESLEGNPHSKIEKVEDKEYYEASSAQKRIYMIQKFDKYSIAYNMPVVFELEGQVNKKRIEETFKKLVIRNESLTTYFKTFEGKIVQKIDNSYKFKIEEKKHNEKIEVVENQFIKPFDLERAPLFRIELAVCREKTYLLIDMHHIISDGVSMEILIKEFTILYNGESLEPLKLQYKDFAAWQNNFLRSEKIKKQEEYWINTFNDEIPVLNLPYDYERPTVQSFDGDNVSFEVNEKTTESLRMITKETGTTMHMVLLSAFNILLSKYSGQEDIVVGTPIAGRAHSDLQNIMGMFVNTLALRNKPKGDKKYIDFLKELRENSLMAYENQSYQLEALVEKLDVRRDTSRNPLFDVMFNMVDTVTHGDLQLEGVLLKQYNNENKISKFDLTLNALEKDNKLKFSIEYCSKLFNKDTIKRLSNHWLGLLDNIISNTKIRICEIDLLTEKERNQILYEFNDTKAEYPKEKTIQELFEEQVYKTPDNIAVVFKDKKVTYRELNEKVNSLARILRDKGVGPEDIVAIKVDRSIEMIVGMMATLKAGGAYLPIDPEYPEDRIKYMMKDCEVKIILTQRKFVKSIDCDLETIDLQDNKSYEKEKSNVYVLNNANDLAYIIYTSGSTGVPKGVLIEHKSVVRLVKDTNYISINNDDVILQLSNYAFDGSVFDIYGALLNGAKLVLMNKNDLLEINKLGNAILNEKISMFFVTTALFNTVVDTSIKCLKNIRKIIFGGERISVKHAKKALEYLGKGRLVHVYGPTEGTVYTTYHFIDYIEENVKNIPIGKSISNSTAYVLGKNNELLPIGVSGELCIGGDGLARGYLNRPDLTSEKFVDNPFELATKMYKTGDLARWLPNGNIEFLGRIDNQVKIRGFRIELGEIENRLLQYEDVKEVAVVVKENREKEKYICAYVVSEKEISDLTLKSYLKERLPEYMVPAYFMHLEKMPITSNGKIDRKSLPDQSLDSTLNKYEAPRNEVEEKLSKIWGEVLGCEKVGINDNFFELGGHSLKATVLIYNIHKELNREIPLRALFKAPTIKDLSIFIENADENTYTTIEKVEDKKYYEASSAQKGMYMLQQFEKDSIAYNMPVVFKLEGRVNKERMEETFKNLVMRHEALRTSFEIVEGEIIQKVHDEIDFTIEYKKVDNGNYQDIIDKFIRPFDLSKVPLLRIAIVKVGEENNFLIFDMHHIISDGSSIEILVAEFIQLYNGEMLQPLRIQYKDYAVWQNQMVNSEKMMSERDYWLAAFDGDIPVIDLPLDMKRQALKSYAGETFSFRIQPEIVIKLKEITKREGVTAYMLFLAAYTVFLAKYSGQDDIVIGTPLSGRTHPDLEKIVGMFVNTLPLRNYPSDIKIFVEYLHEVKAGTLKAIENQDYTLDLFLDDLKFKREAGRNPLFDVLFTWQENSVGKWNVADVNFTAVPYLNKVSKFDLTFVGHEDESGIKCDFEYNTQLFKPETIELMCERFLILIESIASNSTARIADLDWRTKFEKEFAIVEEIDFNF